MVVRAGDVVSLRDTVIAHGNEGSNTSKMAK